MAKKRKSRFCINLGFFIFLVVLTLLGSSSILGEVGTEDLSSGSNIVGYDKEIVETFEIEKWVKVKVYLEDNSGVTVRGTTDRRRSLSNQIDEWFGSVMDDILSNFSEDEFDLIIKDSRGFRGYVTGEGFNKLIEDERVSDIYLANKTVSIALSDSVQLIDVDPEVWDLGYTGNGIDICVIDSGVNASHSNLSGKIIDEYCYCDSGCCPNGSITDTSAEDDNGHGTNVVGIIAS